ncbi:MAG: hypothetical protein AAGF12_33430 [Myxococcota bacterium]
MSEAQSAYRLATTGDFSDAARLCERSAPSDAWVVPLRAITFNTAPDLVRQVVPEEVAAIASTPDAAALALRQLVLAAFLRFDRTGLDRARRALGEIESRGTSPLLLAIRELAEGWLAISEGARPTFTSHASWRQRVASHPDLLVEREVITVLDSLHLGDLDEATTLARRTSRMAGSEGFLQAEYLANLALARTRRRAGMGHLAVRILRALAEVVPDTFRPWIEWELACAGEVEATPLASLLETMTRADRWAVHELFRRAAEATSAFPDLRTDLETLHGLLHPDVEGDIAWSGGQTHPIPRGLRNPSKHPLSAAVVYCAPGKPARRFLQATTAFFPSAQVLEAQTRAARVHTSLSALALAQHGLEAGELFELAHGFPMTDAAHEDALRGLVHRLRKELGDAGTIERRGQLALRPKVPLLIPDPRTDHSLADRVLMFLAAGSGRATARDVARALKLPLRTVQRLLGGMVEDGSCASIPDGRRVEYVVEDTTFSEPTLHRLRAQLPD